jgi:hypothetical protein
LFERRHGAKYVYSCLVQHQQLSVSMPRMRRDNLQRPAWPGRHRDQQTVSVFIRTATAVINYVFASSAAFMRSPSGLALIVGSLGIVSAKATVGAFFPVMLYLYSGYLVVGSAFLLVGIRPRPQRGPISILGKGRSAIALSVPWS